MSAAHHSPLPGSSTAVYTTNTYNNNLLALRERRHSRPRSWHSTTSSLRFADIDPDSQSLDFDNEHEYDEEKDEDGNIVACFGDMTVQMGLSPHAYHLSSFSPSQGDNAFEFTRHPDLWFADGSVVLVAGRTLFRVHKSLLARHSSFFKDMFTLPQPPAQIQVAPAASSSTQTTPTSPTPSSTLPIPIPNANAGHPKLKSLRSKRDLRSSPIVNLQRTLSGNGYTEMEGCPVVYLHDTPEDLASLLYALYDGPTFGANDKADFRVTSGILRLATKYLIDSLRTKSLDHLSIAWPSTLKGWDAREDLVGEYYVDMDGGRKYPSPVEIILLAREIHAPQLLPSAFYDLSRYPMHHIFESTRDELHLHRLSLADTQKLVLGREAAHGTVCALIRAMASEAGGPNPMGAHAGIAHGHVHGHTHGTGGGAAGMNGGGVGPIGIGAPRGNGNGVFGIMGQNNGGAHGHGHGHGGGRQHHRRISSTGCTTSAACRRDVSELASLATQHYLLDQERGCRDPLYVAEELGLLKSAEMNLYEDVIGGNNGGNGAGAGGEGDVYAGGECKACGRMLEMWARKERERIWRLIPGWFRLD